MKLSNNQILLRIRTFHSIANFLSRSLLGSLFVNISFVASLSLLKSVSSLDVSPLSP